MKRRGRLAALVLLLASCLLAGKSLLDHRAETRALEHERRANIVDLIPANIGGDAEWDVVAVYEPSMSHAPGTRFSQMEAYDGSSGAKLWTNRLERWLQPDPDNYQRRFVVGPEHFVVASYGSGDNLPGIVWAHSLRTGDLVWKREFPDSHGWRGAFRVWLSGELLLVLTNNAAPGMEAVNGQGKEALRTRAPARLSTSASGSSAGSGSAAMGSSGFGVEVSPARAARQRVRQIPKRKECLSCTGTA